MRCEGCGAESPLKELFVRRQRFSGIGYKMLCPGCIRWRKQASARAQFAFVLLAGIASIGLAYRVGLYWPANVALSLVFVFISIIPHEVGHAAASLLTGMEIFRIRFGTGRRLWHAFVRGVLIEVRAIPTSGSVQTASVNVDGWRWRRFVFVVAGPMANIVLCLTAIWMIGGWAQFVDANNWTGHLSPWLIFGVGNALFATINLIKTEPGIEGVPPDGVKLARLLFRPIPSAQDRRWSTSGPSWIRC
jgi:hypothetical protein